MMLNVTTLCIEECLEYSVHGLSKHILCKGLRHNDPVFYMRKH